MERIQSYQYCVESRWSSSRAIEITTLGHLNSLSGHTSSRDEVLDLEAVSRVDTSSADIENKEKAEPRIGEAGEASLVFGSVSFSNCEGSSSMLLGLVSSEITIYIGVLLISRWLGEGANLGFQYLTLDNTLLWSNDAENRPILPRDLSSSTRLLVNECCPTPGANASKPHAAIISVIPLQLLVAELAAAQQSRRIRTSDSACSSMV